MKMDCIEVMEVKDLGLARLNQVGKTKRWEVALESRSVLKNPLQPSLCHHSPFVESDVDTSWVSTEVLDPELVPDRRSYLAMPHRLIVYTKLGPRGE